MVKTQDPAYVMRQVETMQNRIKSSESHISDDELKNEFAEFHKRCPHIFAKARSPMSQTDMDILSNMLRKLGDIRRNNVSHEDGSREIGELLVDTFVKPMLKDKTT